MIKIIDKIGIIEKEVKLEELNEHLRWRCEDYLNRNKNKDIVIDGAGNINCVDCTDCTDCEDCSDCVGCDLCANCAYCDNISCETGAVFAE